MDLEFLSFCKVDYEMWKLRIEQYFQVQDYALWEVIEYGNSFKPVARTTTNADGENISQEDLNLKFLRSLPSEWSMHVVVWRNKPDLGTISFDDFKIVEQEVKRSVTSSSNSSSQNVAFVSTPNSSNEDNTANVQVNTVSTNVSTASTNDSTACLSDATIYAFLANQPNRSQVVHEDLKQIHEDDLKEMDLKWQLALLKCFNCHKMGHFARACKGHRNQESMPRNQESSKRTVNVEDTSSKAMVVFDGAGFDWSFMADEESSTQLGLWLSQTCGLFAPPTIDLSSSGLKEFQQPEFEGYGVNVNKSVSENSSNEIRNHWCPISKIGLSYCDED
ncbi:putative ribonuclease H-like domain-containing protein [Tanacetum coccineum]